jgi:hypothetical protein
VGHGNAGLRSVAKVRVRDTLDRGGHGGAGVSRVLTKGPPGTKSYGRASVSPANAWADSGLANVVYGRRAEQSAATTPRLS